MFQLFKKELKWTYSAKGDAKARQAKLNPNKWASKIELARKDGRFTGGWVLIATRLPRK